MDDDAVCSLGSLAVVEFWFLAGFHGDDATTQRRNDDDDDDDDDDTTTTVSSSLRRSWSFAALLGWP